MTKELFFDTDCLSAFLWINNTNILEQLYSGQIVLPEPVYRELSNPCIPHIKQRTDALIANNVAKVQEIKADTKEYKIYLSLVSPEKGRKIIGRGEAGGIALAITYDGILASNNLSDIEPYVEKYNLSHIDTGRILFDALQNDLITEADGNNIWQQMISKRRKLPAVSFSEYLKGKICSA
ncbi:MAG: hypothetical protein J1D87_09825 [Lachnospiraceae bacterium]|nr:hypothetical protein [Lachnospiraceae bacterium]